MANPLFSGLCTALVTPFLDDQVNYPMLDVLIRRQMAAGVEAVVLCGTTGEAPTLTDQEKLAIFRRGVQVADGQCRIIAGTGSNDTRHAVALSQQAQRCGVDGLLVVSPYYNKATFDGLVAHYSAISQAVDLPIIAYNVPSRTGLDITVEMCRELRKLPNLAGIKEAGGDVGKTMRIVADHGKAFPVWSGNDDQTVAMMAVGAQGVISVASNVAPLAMNAMVTAAKNGDFDLAALMQRKLLPLTDLLFCQVNPVPVKAAMRCIGYDVGSCRLPLTELSPRYQQKLRDFFAGWRDIP